jgi:hypothetical protein
VRQATKWMYEITVIVPAPAPDVLADGVLGTGIFRCVRKIAKSDSFVMSVRPHGTALFPLDGFAWSLIFENFSKTCWEYSFFINIWQE